MPSLKRDASGCYVVRFRVGGRGSRFVRRNLGDVPYKEAADRAAKIVAEEKAKRAGDPNLTFADLSKEYQKTHSPNVAESSRGRIEEVVRLRLDPFFGAMKVDGIRPLDVERFRRLRLDAKAAPATVNREWAILKAILNKAEAWGLIDRNPIRRGAVKLLPDERARLAYFEVEEWGKLIAAFDDSSRWEAHVRTVTRLGPVKLGKGSPEERRYGGGRRPDSEATADYLKRLRATRPVLEALLFTGSRLSEILGLTWDAVDLRRELVTFRQKKTRRLKSVPISKDLAEVLKALPRGVGAAPVFTRPDGGAFYPMEVQRAFTLAKKLSGIRPALRLHDLRHTFASWLATRGTPLRTIQELLGHADIRMTIRYAHLAPAHLRDAVDAIGEILAESRGDSSGDGKIRVRNVRLSGNSGEAG